MFEGPLAAAPVLPLGGIGRNRRRGYLFTVTLPSSAGNEYAAASSRIDLRWTAGALNQKAPCVAEFHGLGPGGLNGTIGGDRITGSPRADRIKGLAGRDCLFGEGGNDHLLGARDEDRLYGGNGDDLLDGGGGTDRLNGGAGSDRIRAGGGTRDIVRCGRGLDRASVDRLDRVLGCERVEGR